MHSLLGFPPKIYIVIIEYHHMALLVMVVDYGYDNDGYDCSFARVGSQKYYDGYHCSNIIIFLAYDSR